MKQKHILLRTVMLCLFAALFVWSANPVIYATTDTRMYLLDEGNLFPESQKSHIESELKEHNTDLPYQVVIITDNKNQPLTETQMQDRADLLTANEG